MEDLELLKTVTAKAQTWLGEGYDEETKAEVKKMLENEDKTDLIECFYKDLEFGTGGLRGIMGVGSNRMNIYTVGAATQGLANYLRTHLPIWSRFRLSLVMTFVTTAVSLLRLLPTSSPPMASRSIFLKALAQLLKCRMQFACSVARVV